jgi:hypothetical protein
MRRVYTPRMPSFFDGAGAVLLTNYGGFSAQLKAQGSASGEETTSGKILGRGSKLLYAPNPEETKERNNTAGEFSFVWDTATGVGFVMSEALQGYATVAIKSAVTNVWVAAGQPIAEKINGQPCEVAQALVQFSDGKTSVFDVFRASTLRGFPLRIRSGTNTPPLTVEFSKVRFETPPEDLFVLPEGYTKYPSPEAISDELAARQLNLRRGKRIFDSRSHDHDFSK